MFYSDKADIITIRYLCLKYCVPEDLAEEILNEFLSVKLQLLEQLHQDGTL